MSASFCGHSYVYILSSCVSNCFPFLYLQDEATERTHISTSPSTSPSTSSSTSSSDPLPRLRARVALELSRAGKWLVTGLRGYAESVNPTMAYDARARHTLHVASSGYPTTFPYALWGGIGERERAWMYVRIRRCLLCVWISLYHMKRDFLCQCVQFCYFPCVYFGEWNKDVFVDYDCGM